MCIKDDVVKVMRSHLKGGNSFRDAVHYAYQLFSLQSGLSHMDIIDIWKKRDRVIVKKEKPIKCLYHCKACADHSCSRRQEDEN